MPAALRGGRPAGRDGARTTCPIVLAGSVEGPRRGARPTYDRAARAPPASSTSRTSPTTARSQERTVALETPDERLDTAFAWAKVGIDKGLATNPLLGTGLRGRLPHVGRERAPGLRLDLRARRAVDRAGRPLLRRLRSRRARRSSSCASSSATTARSPTRSRRARRSCPGSPTTSIPWAVRRRDAALRDRAGRPLARAAATASSCAASWDSIVKAWRFTAATDTRRQRPRREHEGRPRLDGGQPALPAARGDLPAGPLDRGLPGAWPSWRTRWATPSWPARPGRRPSARGTRSRRPTGWATAASTRSPPRWRSRRSATTPSRARAAPRARRASRRCAARRSSTRTRCCPRSRCGGGRSTRSARSPQIDHLGSARAGHRLGRSACSRTRSELYDPLSYHYGSVWPLFTGWAVDRRLPLRPPARRLPGPDGQRAAHVPVARSGYVTELLSGDFNAPFGRSSHHQVWSEAMVVHAARPRAARHRGRRGGRRLTFAPQLPADWDRAAAAQRGRGRGRVTTSASSGGGTRCTRARRSRRGHVGDARARARCHPRSPWTRACGP